MISTRHPKKEPPEKTSMHSLKRSGTLLPGDVELPLQVPVSREFGGLKRN